MEKQFDLTKPFSTRDGRKADLLLKDLNSNKPIVAKITDDEGYQSVHSFYPCGSVSSFGQNALDLINIPEIKESWFNVYRDVSSVFSYFSFGFPYDTLVLVEASRRKNKIGILHLSFTEEEGLKAEIVED